MTVEAGGNARERATGRKPEDKIKVGRLHLDGRGEAGISVMELCRRLLSALPSGGFLWNQFTRALDYRYLHLLAMQAQNHDR
ncbi:MAG: hypothetical protein WA830_16185 [Candidatus Sulfotelmatobacter sp.]